MSDNARPLPTVSPDNRPFWEACARGLLLLPHCARCDDAFWPPSPVCPHCLEGPPDWREASGRGIVSTFVGVHKPWFPAFKDALPYNVAQIQLDEGPRLTAAVVGASNNTLSIGLEVVAIFEERGDGVYLPMFRPRGTQQD